MYRNRAEESRTGAQSVSPLLAGASMGASATSKLGDELGTRDAQLVPRAPHVAVRGECEQHEVVRGERARNRDQLLGADRDFGGLAHLQALGGLAHLREDAGVLDHQRLQLHAFRRLHLGGLDGDAVEAHQGGGERAVDAAADGQEVLAESHQRPPRRARTRSSRSSSRAISSAAGGASSASRSRATASPPSANLRKISRARPARPCFRYSSANVTVTRTSTQAGRALSRNHPAHPVPVSWLAPSQAIGPCGAVQAGAPITKVGSAWITYSYVLVFTRVPSSSRP